MTIINDKDNDKLSTNQRNISSTLQFKALIGKNIIQQKRRNFVSLFGEFFLPILFILLLTYLSTLLPPLTIPSGWSSTNKSPTNSKLGTSKNVFTLRSSETSLSGILLELSKRSVNKPENVNINCLHYVQYQGYVSLNTSSDYKIPSICYDNNYDIEDSIVPNMIAITPDNIYTRNYFYQTIIQWYPRISLTSNTSSFLSKIIIPALEDLVIFFDSNDALNKYITNNNYGLNPNNPRIYAAISFDNIPTDTNNIDKYYSNFEYSIRMNSTLHKGGSIGDVVRTIGTPPALNLNKKDLDVTSYQAYTKNGFMTLQTLIHRFIICNPSFDTNTNKSTGTCQHTNALNSNISINDAINYYQNDAFFTENLQLLLQGNGQSISSFNWSSIPDESIQKLLTPLKYVPNSVNSYVYPFPLNEYKYASFFDVISTMFPFVFMLCYMFTISRIISLLTLEKETKSREIMKIMGVNESTIIWSWYTLYIFINIFVSLLQAIIAAAGLFKNSSFIIIFFYFFFFSCDAIAYSFLVSSCFTQSKTAASVGVFLFMVMSCIIFGFNDQTSEISKVLVCLLAPAALGIGSELFATLETSSIGVNSSTVNSQVNNIKFSIVLLFMVIDFVLYTALGFYFEAVIPKDYGVQKKWYFPIQYVTSIFKKGNKSNAVIIVSPTIANNDVDSGSNYNVTNTPHMKDGNNNISNETIHVEHPERSNSEVYVEEITPELKEQERRGNALIICNIIKKFTINGIEKIAVNNLNLKMYEGQITCLLGHNGAGKTTTISILTGMIPPTDGNATFQGLNIRDNMKDIRKSLGICPQHDVLYPTLTVEEHLILYGKFKGYQGKELQDVVKQKIAEVGLTEKKKVQSISLSGGMKRKLSVAIALLGDSKLVFLDEPTSGMDPYSRRSTWQILQNNRSGRIMILTTHFMDEADLLGDRIAIMAEGKLRCCGTPLFLKNKYGAGYNLTIVKDQNCNEQNIIQLMKKYIPGGRLLSNVGAEISFQLPIDSSSLFPVLFREMDNNLKTYNILQYGISVTTMEEVFIRVADTTYIPQAANAAENAILPMLNETEHDIGSDKAIPILDGDQGVNEQKENNKGQMVNIADVTNSYVLTENDTKRTLFFYHVYALLLKRWQYSKRDKKAVLYTIFLPVVIILAGMSLIKSANFDSNDPKKILSVNDYPLKTNTPASYYFINDGNPITTNLISSINFLDDIPSQITSNIIPQPPYSSINDINLFGINYTQYVSSTSSSAAYALKFSDAMFNKAFDTSGYVPEYGGYLINTTNTGSVSYTLFVNTTSIHAAPIFKKLVDLGIYRSFISYYSNGTGNSANIVANSYPLPIPAKLKKAYNSIVSLVSVIFIILGLGYFPAGIIIFLIKEKQKIQNSKHQQYVSGASITSYWIANLIWDIITYCVSYIILLILIQAFDITTLTGSSCTGNCISDTFTFVALILFLLGFALCSFTYLTSYLFQEPSWGQNVTIVLNLIFGLILVIASFVLDAISSTKNINKYLKYIWRFFPIYTAGNALLEITNNALESSLGISAGSTKSAFDVDIGGVDLIYIICISILYMSLTILVDYIICTPKVYFVVSKFLNSAAEKKSKKIPTGNETGSFIGSDNVEDEDIIKERERVERGDISGDILTLKGLIKVYYKPNLKKAINNLNFSIKKGECFGFLGINGAGKTSTMKIITGDEIPTYGKITLAGYDVLTEQIHVRRRIGYCPQFDALLDYLTVREHLELFSRIKGVPSSVLESVVKEKLHQLDLKKFENKLSCTLSGGNKRKLSVAIALLGSPPVVFLDEPSTGVDPVARRFMWNIISNISTKKKDSTIMLTTHSMEECEALCSRVGIMIGGKLKCLGGIQHIKSKYGTGLMIEIKLELPNDIEIKDMAYKLIPSFNETQQHNLSLNDIQSICSNENMNERYQWINPQHVTGWLLYDTYNKTQYIPYTMFIEWWINETHCEKLKLFLIESFGSDNISLLERHGVQYRYHLNKTKENGLSDIFQTIENGIKDTKIKEYSVSQTTLEQIFNSFASKQEEEKGFVRGMENKEK